MSIFGRLPALSDAARFRAASPAEGGEADVSVAAEAEAGEGLTDVPPLSTEVASEGARSGVVVASAAGATLAAAITETCNDGRRIGLLKLLAAEVNASVSAIRLLSVVVLPILEVVVVV